MFNNNVTDRRNHNLKKVILRKIAAFVFSINMIFGNMLAISASAQTAEVKEYTVPANAGFVSEKIYSTELPEILSPDDFHASVEKEQSVDYSALIGESNPETSYELYNNLLGNGAGFNLFVEDDCTLTGSDVGGRVAAGGDITVTASSGWYSVNIEGIGGKDAASVICGGTLNMKVNSINVWANATGDYINNGGKTVIGGIDCQNGGFSFADSFEYIRESSAKLAQMQANGLYSYTDYNTAALEFTGVDEELNIFTISADKWNELTRNSYLSINLVIPENATAILNIVGDTDEAVNLQVDYICLNGRQIGATENYSNFLINVSEAENIALVGFNGSVLAPNAYVEGIGRHQEGQLICKSYNGYTEFGQNSFDASDFIEEEDNFVPDADTDTDTDTDTDIDTDLDMDIDTDLDTDIDTDLDTDIDTDVDTDTGVHDDGLDNDDTFEDVEQEPEDEPVEEPEDEPIEEPEEEPEEETEVEPTEEIEEETEVEPIEEIEEEPEEETEVEPIEEIEEETEDEPIEEIEEEPEEETEDEPIEEIEEEPEEETEDEPTEEIEEEPEEETEDEPTEEIEEEPEEETEDEPTEEIEEEPEDESDEDSDTEIIDFDDTTPQGGSGDSSSSDDFSNPNTGVEINGASALAALASAALAATSMLFKSTKKK